MRTIVVNPLSTGFSHAVFDATLLTVLSEMTGKQLTAIDFIGEKRHVDEIKSILGTFSDKITFIPIKERGQGQIATTLCCFRAFHFLERLKRINHKICPIFVAADNTLTPLYLSMRWSTQKRAANHMPPLIVSHNNIQSIVCKIQKRRRWQNAVSRSGVKFMVLENQLFEQAKNILGVANTIRLKHPTYGHIKAYEKAKKARKYLSFLYDFVMIGRHGRVKESVREILQASEEIMQESFQEIDNKTIRIAFTGSEMDLVPSDHRIQLTSLGKYPAFDEYLLAIARSRFVVFSSAARTRMTASGTLADAMSVGTPVIAPAEGDFQSCGEDFKEFGRLFYKSNYRLKFSLKYALEIKEKEYQRVSDIVKTTAQKRCSEFTAGICGALNKCMEIKQI